MANVVVVGGGFAGLSAAARLAKLRHDVALLEAGDRLGGRLHGHVVDGQAWPLDVETVSLPGVFRDLFRKSGRPLERVLELTKTAGRRHMFDDRSVLDLPLGNRGDQHEAIVGVFGEDEWSPWVDQRAETLGRHPPDGARRGVSRPARDRRGPSASSCVPGARSPRSSASSVTSDWPRSSWTRSGWRATTRAPRRRSRP